MVIHETIASEHSHYYGLEDLSIETICEEFTNAQFIDDGLNYHSKIFTYDSDGNILSAEAWCTNLHKLIDLSRIN